MIILVIQLMTDVFSLQFKGWTDGLNQGLSRQEMALYRVMVFQPPKHRPKPKRSILRTDTKNTTVLWV